MTKQLNPAYFAPWAVDVSNASEAMTNAAETLVLWRNALEMMDDDETSSYIHDLTDAVATVRAMPYGIVFAQIQIRANRIAKGYPAIN